MCIYKDSQGFVLKNQYIPVKEVKAENAHKDEQTIKVNEFVNFV